MEHDIIAFLYPHTDPQRIAEEAIQASPCYVPPRLVQHSRRERESTEPPDDHSALDYLPCLELRFSDIPRTNRGLVFGYHSNCDIVLSHRGISNCHFSLTFDDDKRLIVKDWGSLVGTQVTYDGKGDGTRRHFQWIVGGHAILQKMQSIIIAVPKTVSFQLVVPHHDRMSPTYIASVDRFCWGTATAEGLLEDLGLSNPETRRATGSHTPGTGEIELRRKLGEGAFGVVTHLWNVSTGGERVVKAPTVNAIRKRQANYDEWRREARLMGQVSHPHVVRLLDSVFTPHPQLYLEYIPLGSLDDHEDVSYDETLTIVRQCLSALTCLHENRPPIAHRDIKPANILVQYRSEGDIFVKLGDFGLSRDRSELMTICGTRRYLAPEIYLESQRYSSDEERMGYTAAVDIWSLGVVACELTCGLPHYKDRYQDDGVAWCKRVIQGLRGHLQTWPNGLGQLLLDNMLVLTPKSRSSASNCYNLVVDLYDTEDGGFRASPTSYPGEEEHNHGAEDPATVVWNPRSHTHRNAATSSSFMRSGAPAPQSTSSSRMTQIREDDRSEAPSSSAIRRYTNRHEGHELTHFLEDYSADPFNSLFVGSSLASELGEKDGSASQFSQVSVQQDQTKATGAQTGAGSGLATSSIPRSEKEVHPKNEGSTTEGRNLADLEDYAEMEKAALLLQAMGQPR